MATATPSEPEAGGSAGRRALAPCERLALRDGSVVWLRAPGTASGGTTGAAGERPSLDAADGALEAADDELRRVGWAAYVRVYGPRACLTLEVDGGYWHNGLPELLLSRLCAGAAGVGISRFMARVPASDMPMLALLREAFAAAQTRDGGHVDAEFSTHAPHG